MEVLGKYIISVTAAAIICSIVMRIVGKNGSQSNLIRSICALFLLFSATFPIAHLNSNTFLDFTESIEADAEYWKKYGESSARSFTEKRISDSFASYICDRAAALGANITAIVSLDHGTMIPEQIIIEGAVSPYCKMQLTEYITSELGVSEGRLLWQ